MENLPSPLCCSQSCPGFSPRDEQGHPWALSSLGLGEGLGWQEQLWTDVGWTDVGGTDVGGTDVQLPLSLPGGCRRDPVLPLSRGLPWSHSLIVTLNKTLQSHSLDTEWITCVCRDWLENQDKGRMLRCARAEIRLGCPPWNVLNTTDSFLSDHVQFLQQPTYSTRLCEVFINRSQGRGCHGDGKAPGDVFHFCKHVVAKHKGRRKRSQRCL